MKNVKNCLFFAFVLTLLLLVLSACGGGGEETVRVMVSAGEGASIVSQNPVEIAKGGTAVFRVEIAEGYVYKSSTGATYNSAEGTLTAIGVRKNTNIDFLVEKADFDPNATYAYVFRPDCAYDTSSVAAGPSVKGGTVIKLSAGDTTRIFEGWTVGYSLAGGGMLVSTEREFDLLVNDKVAAGGVLTVYANYKTIVGITYHTNGGTLNSDSASMHSAYYTATATATGVKVEYTKTYLDYFECASTFTDDTTFTRPGYVLIEYNTKADGTGTAYSIGSKVPMVTSDKQTELYCIWSAESPASDFTYEDITIPYPQNVNAQKAPHWQTSGVVITGYRGNDKTVTVPQRIGGKPVTAIAAGAFINKDMETLVLHRGLLKVCDNAFLGCDSLTTVYYPDGLYEMSDAAFDDLTYTSFKNFYVNATLKPRNVSSDVGALSVKLSRLLAGQGQKMLVVIGGSSSLQGLATEYLEALLDGQYRIVNFGTTRTTHGAMYLEAMGALLDADDTVIYAPENSAYMFGERALYYKTFRDLEGMVNIYRYVDFSNYTGMFSAMTELNKAYRFTASPKTYEEICAHGELTVANPTYANPTTNKYGDFLRRERADLVLGYMDHYYITLNERVKSRYEGAWNDGDTQAANKDYTDPANVTWASLTDAYFKDNLNRSIQIAKSSGAGVYFGFCPVDASALVDGAEDSAWQMRYDALIDSTFNFDGNVGTVSDYIWHHKYFYDCAFHLNDTGRVLRTYRMYIDLAAILGYVPNKKLYSVGTGFAGCLFEDGGTTGALTDWRAK